VSSINRIEVQFVEVGTGRLVSSFRTISRASDGASRSIGFLQQSLTALGAAAALRYIYNQIDAFTNLQNRLRLVTKDQRELVAIYDKLFEVSQRTRTSIETNADLFNRLATSTAQLKLTYRELIDLTETLNKLVQVGGYTAREAEAGLIQLSQGLSSGALRADELRSVIEQLPGVADAFAKELGITRGSLRTLGAQGKITSEVMIRALRNVRQEAEDKFAKALITPSQAMTQLENSVINFIGRLDAATGTSRSFASATKAVGDVLDIITHGLSGLALLIQQDTALMNGLGTAFRLFAAIATVLVGIAIVQYFAGMAIAIAAASVASGPLLAAFLAIYTAVSGLVGIKLGAWLYENTQAFRELGDWMAKTVLYIDNLFEWLGKSIVSHFKTAFATITKEMWTDLVKPGFGMLQSLLEGIEKPVSEGGFGLNLGGASKAIAGLINVNDIMRDLDKKGILSVSEKIVREEEYNRLKLKISYDKTKKLIEQATDDIANARNKELANQKPSEAKDWTSLDTWRQMASDVFGEINKSFDSLVSEGTSSIVGWFKKIGDEAIRLGLATQSTADVLGNYPAVIGAATKSLSEYSKEQKRAIDNMDNMISDLEFEIETMFASATERDRLSAIRKVDEIQAKGLADALDRLAEAENQYNIALKKAESETDPIRKADLLAQVEREALPVRVALAEVEEVRAEVEKKRERVLGLIEQRTASILELEEYERRKSLNEQIENSIESLERQIQAYDDLSGSVDSAMQKIEFAALANKRFAGTQGAANQKINQFNALVDELNRKKLKASFIEEAARTNDDLNLQILAMKDFSQSQEMARAKLEFSAKAMQAFGNDTAGAEDAIAKFVLTTNQLEQLEQFRSLVEDISNTIAGSFEDLIFEAKSLEDALEDMVKNVARTVFNQLVTQQIAGFFTGFLGSAMGPAFGIQGIKGFAMGGVIDRPTFLGLADGMPAIGGESGPEAVVPLPDGRQIPVMLRGEGGNRGGNVTNVTMNIQTPDSDSFRRSQRQITDQLSMQMRRRR
jgi:tape measure domain-containing protein